MINHTFVCSEKIFVVFLGRTNFFTKSSYLIHVLDLCVLIRLHSMASIPHLPLIILIIAFDIHFYFLTLAILLITLLDEDAGTKLLRGGGWGEVAWKIIMSPSFLECGWKPNWSTRRKPL